MDTFFISTANRTQFIEITTYVQNIIDKNKIKDGICYIYVPHTTAAVTINENADPDVCFDIDFALDKLPDCD